MKFRWPKICVCILYILINIFMNMTHEYFVNFKELTFGKTERKSFALRILVWITEISPFFHEQWWMEHFTNKTEYIAVSVYDNETLAGRKWNYTFQHFKLLLKLKYMSFSFYLLTINMKRGLGKKTKLYISSDNKHRHCLLIQIL